MKKLFTLIAFIGFAFGANAQRHVNLATRAVALWDADTVYHSGDKFPFKVLITNFGPDSLRTSDTVFVQVAANADTVWATLQMGSLALGAGQSVIVSDTNLTDPAIVIHTWHGYASDSLKTFCARQILQNRTQNPIDDTIANNTVCGTNMILVDVHNLNAAINGLKIYPNPAQSYINFDLTLNKSGNTSIRIMDVTGRIVLNEDKGKLTAGNHKLSLNIADLSNGVYIYQVMVGDEITNGRFSIAK